MGIFRNQTNRRIGKFLLRHRSFAGISLGSLLTIAFLTVPPKMSASVTPAQNRKAAPDFALTNANGATFRLSDFKGRVVVLDFWATWCHGCKTEIPWFMEFEKEFKRSGLTVIGVSMDKDGWKSVKPFLATEKMNYTVVIGNEAMAKQFEIGPLPKTFLIDRNGKIADSYTGVVNKIAWKSEISKLLGTGAKNDAR